MLINLILALSLIGYFSISWFVPWEELTTNSTISISYLFDIFIVLLAAFSFRKIPNLKLNLLRHLAQFIFAIFLAGIFAYLPVHLQWQTPFKYLDKLFIQLIILAPLIEEFVFRFSLYELQEKSKLPTVIKYLINAIAFSISHAPALWILPEVFHQFIIYQLGYTFVLGLYCYHIKFRYKSDSAVIVIHLLFNLVFYGFVKLSLL